MVGLEGGREKFAKWCHHYDQVCVCVCFFPLYVVLYLFLCNIQHLGISIDLKKTNYSSTWCFPSQKKETMFLPGQP